MSHHPKRRAMLACLLSTAIAGTALAATASARVDTPAVPPAVEIGAGHVPYLVGHATGVQIYGCAATPDGPKWGLIAPRANLYGDQGQLIATHFAGPSWQAKDGSLVRAARVDGATPDPTAIPWLKLKATSTEAGPDGARLVRTSYIQRIATTGGLAPAASECTTDTIGAQQEIPYTADYVFYRETA